MKRYKIFYAKTFMMHDPIMPTRTSFQEHWAFVGDCLAETHQETYTEMQACNWQPGKHDVLALELSDIHHASMSVGDLAIDPDQRVWQVMHLGWRQVEL